MGIEETEFNPEQTKTQELTYEIKVGQAMERDVITVYPHTPMCKFQDLLRENQISGVPVVKKRGQLVGIISIEDLIKAMSTCDTIPTKKMAAATVEEYMTCSPETLYADEPLVKAISKFNKLKYGRFPVVNRQGDLVGIITKGNIVQTILKRLETDYHQKELLSYRAGDTFENIISDEINLVFHYHVESEDFDSAGEASSKLRENLQSLGIHPQIMRRIAIASYEAEMNLVLWGEGGDLRVQVYPNKIELETFDTGPGIEDIALAMQPGYSSAPEWVQKMGFGAGMGLPNIQECTDEMHLESTPGEGTHLKAIIYLDEKRTY